MKTNGNSKHSINQPVIKVVNGLYDIFLVFRWIDDVNTLDPVYERRLQSQCRYDSRVQK